MHKTDRFKDMRYDLDELTDNDILNMVYGSRRRIFEDNTNDPSNGEVYKTGSNSFLQGGDDDKQGENTEKSQDEKSAQAQNFDLNKFKDKYINNKGFEDAEISEILKQYGGTGNSEQTPNESEGQTVVYKGPVATYISDSTIKGVVKY